VAVPTPSRTAALAALRSVRRGVLVGPALDHAGARLDPRDRAWAQELVYGTLRMRGRIDHRLAACSSRPLDRVDPDILDILRLGGYQLTEMGGVPSYAAVSQSVELARSVAGGRTAGFVNGVLQSLRRTGDASTFPAFDDDPAGHLSTWGSHPRWLVERWLARLGAEDAGRLVEANNLAPHLYLRVLGDVDAGQAALRAAGVTVEAVCAAPRSFRLLSGGLADALDAAPVIVQDPAAGWVADFVQPPAGARIVDIAAAPGGKAMALASAEPPGRPALVVAADLSEARLARLLANIARLGRPAPRGLGGMPVAALVADGLVPPFRDADVVLLDAPCTGTGTLRRHADGRWRLGPGDVGVLARLQSRLLAEASSRVRGDGLLIYATCSLEREENEDQVAAFLENHPDFELDPPAGVPASMLDDGMLRLLPHVHGWDGAFAARLRRTG
jgi:16S rRNA (cytosine967-C5)-methyltransferase